MNSPRKSWLHCRKSDIITFGENEANWRGACRELSQDWSSCLNMSLHVPFCPISSRKMMLLPSVLQSDLGFHFDSTRRTFCCLHAMFYWTGFILSDKMYNKTLRVNPPLYPFHIYWIQLLSYIYFQLRILCILLEFLLVYC